MDATHVFETKTISEVRDLKLALSLDLVRLKDDLDQRLQDTYTNILDVSDSVIQLHDDFRELDSRFMDLCFYENKYQLNRLEEPELVDEPNPSITSAKTQYMDSIAGTRPEALIRTAELLVLSESVQSITAFRKSPNSLTLQSMLDRLPSLDNIHNERYLPVIQRNCEELSQTILDMGAAPISTHEHVLLFEALEKSKAHAFDSNVFQTLLKYILEDYCKLVHSSPALQRFSKRPDFIEAMHAKLLHDINLQLNSYKTLQTETPDEAFSPYNISSDIDNQFVHNMTSYEQGLTTLRRVAVSKCFDTTISMLLELTNIPGGQTDATTLARRASEHILQEIDHIPQSTDTTDLASTDLVTQLIAKRKNEQYSEHLNAKLQHLNAKLTIKT